MQNKVPSLYKIMGISLPIMISLLAQNIVSITDIAFVADYASDLPKNVGKGLIGAAGLASVFYIVLYMVGFGFASGMQIIIARRAGEGNDEKIGGIMVTGLSFLWVMAAIIIPISIFITPLLLPSIMSSSEVASLASEFMSIRVFGLIFSFVSISFRAFHVGIGQTKPLIWSAVIVGVSNIVLDYILIFGRFGINEMGINGAALASVIAECLGAIFFIIYNYRKTVIEKFQLFKFNTIKKSTLVNILSLSIYVMLQYTISLATWLLFFIFIEKAGEEHLDSSQLVRNIYSLLTIPSWAYASCVNSLVSFSIGEGKSELTLKIIRKITWISILSTFVCVGILLGFGSNLLSILSPDYNLVTISKSAIPIVAVAMIVFSVSVIPFNGISGTGKTIQAMVIEIISLCLYIIGIYIIYKNYIDRPHLFWTAEYIYWGGILILSILYLRSGYWKKDLDKV